MFTKFLGRKKTDFKGSKKDNLKIGNLGENLAKRYLKKKNFKIIRENYKTRYAEIDLICRFKGILVFVEVKTRCGIQFGIPEESLKKEKINKVAKNAQMYMKYRNYSGRYRIDGVCVVLNKNKKLSYLKHYENITL